MADIISDSAETSFSITTEDNVNELILEPVADYSKMEKLSEEEFARDMEQHNRTYEEILEKLNRVETRDISDLIVVYVFVYRFDVICDCGYHFYHIIPK